MDIKELIEKAVESLNRVRQLNLNITGTLSLSDNDDVFYVSILDNESGFAFDVAIDENMSNQQLLPDEIDAILKKYNLYLEACTSYFWTVCKV